MERLAFRGGPYYDGAGAGLFTLGLYVARTMRIQYRGFRPAFAPCVGSLMVMVMRTEQGQEGGVSALGEGKTSAAPRGR